MLGTSPTEFSEHHHDARYACDRALPHEQRPDVSGKTPFTDVRTDEWYSAAVLWAYQNGIVTGMSDTTFAPINNVTREQMATILFRYTKTAAPDKAKASADLSGFADAGSVNDWAVDAMR
ncbi:MAG: S-layer homology domain-containing protein [Oscillospiraceae bacterium]